LPKEAKYSSRRDFLKLAGSFAIARNPRQKLLIEADSNPVWTYTPPKEWFSPKPELVTRELRKSGFHRIRRITIRSHLIMKADPPPRVY
jgi:hypothetical protein